MTKQTLNGLLLSVLMLTVVFADQANAFNLGKALKDAAKQKVDEQLGKPSEPTPATPAPESATPTDATPTAAPSNNAAETSTEKTPEFNWKKPSKEEEIALGREITGSILGAAPLVKDDALQKYVNQVGRWVASQSERADLPWHFGVIESSDLNAFAAPGGYVLITKGLYQKLENESQLAGVLGHEIAHIVKKHQLKVLQKQQLLNAGASIISDQFGKNDKLAKKALSNGAEISARSLDKDAEFEADRMGMVLAARAGYDVYGLSEVLQTMGQINPNDSSLALLYKTHPAPDERLAKLAESAGKELDNVKPGKTLANRLVKTQ